MADGLKLRARDAADLDTISACVQDALVPLAEIQYLPKDRRFALMLNRFRWEAVPAATPETVAPGRAAVQGDAVYADAPSGGLERVHAALVFDRVRSVKRRGLTEAARGGMLSLLTLGFSDKQVVVSFAGGAAVSLEVDQLSCHLEDLGEAWPTVWRPRHGDDEAAGRE